MTIDRLGAHFRRWGTEAQWIPADYTAGETGSVIIDAPEQDVLGGTVKSTEYSVTYRATHFVGMARGDELHIEGACYLVRDVNALDDGQIVRATLSKQD